METMNNVQERSKKNYNFYTANGWAGKNYDQNLSGKDIAKKIRTYVKEKFPDYKFSIRSEFGMHADSIYITLLSGPVQAFIKESSADARGYIETMTNFGDIYKKEIQPEILNIINTVCNYALSYKFDDSDGMIDYFDTNFYLHVSIGSWDKNYIINDTKKRIKSNVPTANTANNYIINANGLEFVEYSEKALAVFGDTKQIKDELKKLGGKFNPYLNYNGEKRAGWVFSRLKFNDIHSFLSQISDEK